MEEDRNLKVFEALNQEFDSLDAYFQAVLEVLQGGHMPDIADLRNRVSHLCSAVMAAPVEFQEMCRNKLKDVLANLDTCQDKIATFHEALIEAGESAQ